MNLCAKCACHTRTCCQDTDVLVTEGDVERITAALGGRSDFWEYRRPTDPENRSEHPSDPHWLAYTLRFDGTRAQLKQKPSRDCIFLGAAGCSLLRATRPLTCRLYPHDYNEQGLSGHHTACPIYLLEPEEDLFESIGIRRHDAEAWRAQLYQELRAGAVYRENTGYNPRP